MTLFKVIIAGAIVMGTASVPSIASAQDMSPVLLLETGPSDNPDYRRMTFTKFIQGNYVTVAYKSYNRSEFKQVRDTTPQEMIDACARGQSMSLRELEAYEREERRREQRGEAPEVKSFCIKNVPNWEAGNRKRYLDPIFNGMPHAKDVN
ncbi:hypothetical protein [Fretibacter rubidus]|uniref:hypothetical protein n=1 Tax=Fretibacter rubidus TaxID=570162 RepID=UPI00352A175C